MNNINYKNPLNPEGYPHTVHLRNTGILTSVFDLFLQEHAGGSWDGVRVYTDPSLDSVNRGFPLGDVVDEYYFKNASDAILFKMRFG